MFKPLGERILVEPEEEPNVQNGLIIPDTAKTIDIQVGTVVSLGSGIMSDTGEEHEFTVKVGDRVGIKRFTPDEVEEDGKKYLIVKESDVLGIIKC